MAEPRYYMTAAYTVGEYLQGDELYLMKLSDGRVIGYSEEFEYATSNVPEASAAETRHLAKWFGVPAQEMENWQPVNLDEIKALQLEKYLIGWKASMEFEAPIEPMTG